MLPNSKICDTTRVWPDVCTSIPTLSCLCNPRKLSPHGGCLPI